MSSFKVDERTENLVYGFVHELETLYKLTSNIPKAIIRLCVLFYFQTEYFEKAGNKMIISGDKNDIIFKTARTWNCYAFGVNWIDSNKQDIIKWTVKITKNKSHNGVVIGIASKDTDINGDVSENRNDGPSYFLHQIIMFMLKVNI